MNEYIFFFLYNLSHRSELADKIIFFTADILPYIVILLAGIFLLFHHEVIYSNQPIKAFLEKWKEITLVFFSGIFAWFLAYFLKIFIHTDRPFVIYNNVVPLFTETDYAFPSGHATFFFALAFAIFFAHKKAGLPAQAGYVFLTFALFIGIARIISGVHFPVDIFGGFILGFVVAYFIKYLFNKIDQKI